MGQPPAQNLGAIASVSHELRAPLHAIVGLAELLVEADLGPHERELASAIHREGQALQVIIDDLLDLSKITAGKMKLLDEAFSPRALVDEVITMFGPGATAKDLSLTLNVRDDLPLAVRGDRHRLRQVLINLVSNAVKYTAHGGIEVNVALHREPDESSAGTDAMQIQFDVSDTGPGIPEGALADLFVPFKQARDRDRTKGTGLGLSITQQLAELMHGELTLETSPSGSTFTVVVPVRAARRATDHAEVESATQAARVLIVDDTDVNRMVARSQLARLGHEPVEASNGADALALLSAEHFDAVLMDWHMPHQDGVETIRLYLQWAADHHVAPVPIIMMTADVSSNAREICAEAGASDFLAKPASLRDLDTRLRRWIPLMEAADGSDIDDGATGDNAATDNGPTDAPAVVIERGVLVQMGEDLGDREAVAMVITTFIDDAANRRSALATIDVDDLNAAHRTAHTLKSTAAMLGATGLSTTCGELEATLGSGQIPEPHTLALFSAQLDATIDQLREIAADFTSHTSDNAAHTSDNAAHTSDNAALTS